MNVYNKIYLALVLAALLSYLAVFNRKEYFKKIIILYLFLLLVTFVSSVYFANVQGLKNNLFLFHISTLFEYVILGILYYKAIISNMAKQLVLVSIPAFTAFSIFLSLFVQPIYENNSYAIITESVLIITWSLFYLREILLLRHITVLHRFPMFWIVIGILFYFTGTLFVQGMLNYLIKNDMMLAKSIYKISHIFEYLLFVLLIVSAYCGIGTKEPHGNSKLNFARNGKQ